MRQYEVTINQKRYTVELLERSGTQLTFANEGKTYSVDVQPLLELQHHTSTPVGTPRRSAARELPVAGAGEVRAPMPGIILDVLVKEGDSVTAGDTVCVIEAMKMENNLPAPTSGIVKSVCCKKGDEVENAALLISIE